MSYDMGRLINSLSPHFAPDAPSGVIFSLRKLLTRGLVHEDGLTVRQMAQLLLPACLKARFLPSWSEEYLAQGEEPSALARSQQVHADRIEWLRQWCAYLGEDEVQLFVAVIRNPSMDSARLRKLGIGVKAVHALKHHNLVVQPDGLALQAANLSLWKVPDLKNICRSLGLKESGKKQDLIDRIAVPEHAGFLAQYSELTSDVLTSALPPEYGEPLQQYVCAATEVVGLWASGEAAYLQGIRQIQSCREARLGTIKIETLGRDACPTCRQHGGRHPIGSVPELPVHPGCTCYYGV